MIPISSEAKDIMKSFAGMDFAKLRLKYASNPDALDAILQLECRKKASSKLPKMLANDDFIFPTSLSVEQCTSELLARFHANLVPDNGVVLDMTCGLGIDAFHIAGKSKSVLALDINPEIADVANHNAQVLGINNFKAVCADSSAYVQTIEDDSFDTIFVDPARRNKSQKVFFIKDCSPNIADLMPRMLRVAKKIIVKASPMLDATAAVRELSCVKNIYSIGTTTECKELVIVCERGYENVPEMHAVTLAKDKTMICDFIRQKDTEDITYTNELCEGKYLYEPYPAVMKIGLFDRLAMEYEVNKFSRDTHLYISDDLNNSFPGRRMRIVYASQFNKRTIKYINSNFPKANVTTRGFVMSAPQLAKKLGIMQGGELFVYGVGLNGVRNYWIAVCEVI